MEDNMTNHINWLKSNQASQSGTTLQTQGNPTANDESPATTVASGLAPAGSNYAMVWADVATQVEASPLRNTVNGQDDVGSFTIAIPANVLLEIPNIIGSRTTITMTDI